MSDLILHILIPLTALLLFYDKRYRNYVILLAPLAILPDFDHVITIDLGRSLFHNVFILVPALGLAALFYVMKEVSDQNDAGTLLYNIAVISTFYLLSHLVLDSFNGGVSLFYPLSTHVYSFVFDLAYQEGNFVPIVGMGIQEPSVLENGVTSLGVGILLTFFIGALFSYRHKDHNSYTYQSSKR